MKKGTLLVVRKPYQGDTVIQNTLIMPSDHCLQMKKIY